MIVQGKQRDHIRFHEGDDILTLWVEKQIEMDDGTPYFVGWCPEKKNNLAVHPANVIYDEVEA